jgi:hypothetical protein
MRMADQLLDHIINRFFYYDTPLVTDKRERRVLRLALFLARGNKFSIRGLLENMIEDALQAPLGKTRITYSNAEYFDMIIAYEFAEKQAECRRFVGHNEHIKIINNIKMNYEAYHEEWCKRHAWEMQEWLNDNPDRRVANAFREVSWAIEDR